MMKNLYYQSLLGHNKVQHISMYNYISSLESKIIYFAGQNNETKPHFYPQTTESEPK